jgi:hypothetical protein
MKRVCINGHSIDDDKALKCSQCGADLPPVPPRKTSKVVIILAAIIGATPMMLCMLFLIFSKSTPQEAATPRPSNTPRPTVTARPTNTTIPTRAPTDTPTAKEALENVIVDNKPSCAERKNVRYGYTENDTHLVVQYECTLFLTEKSLLTSAQESIRRVTPKLFAQLPDISKVSVLIQVPGTDAYGKEIKMRAMGATISRATSAKVVWTSVNPCNFGLILDDFAVHPSLLASYKENCK